MSAEHGPRYTLAEVREFKATLDAVIDPAEADPITVDGQTGRWERKVKVTRRSATVTYRWKPELPIVPTVGAFTETGLDPVLSWQLLDQLEELLSGCGGTDQ